MSIFDEYSDREKLLKDIAAEITETKNDDGATVYRLQNRDADTFRAKYDAVWTPVTGHNNVSAGADCVLSSLQTDDAWDIDNVGYNFLLSPEISTHQLFETAGLYRIKATINLVEGNPITFYKEINVVE